MSTPTTPQPSPQPSAWRRFVRAGAPRLTRAQGLAAVLTLALGFALATQVHQTQERGLASLRQSDLVGILDDVNERQARQQTEAEQLRRQRDDLLSGTDTSRAALQAAQDRLDTLGVLAGTLPATGPGIELVVSDPKDSVRAARLLDAVQELRDAGAEAMQVNGQRIVASTAFVDGARGIEVDGASIAAPYTFEVIGDPQTMAAALDIPGGVLETLSGEGAHGTVTQRDKVSVDALRPLPSPEYARPAVSPTTSH